ncbi:putative LrgA-associated membrane protein LrgB [Vibrio nigripulchritudo SOn1]|uniref:LrgA-associated membrane protein LrgB n=1 Tax=Vibrio nigripulchritudo SOn1 TaxID=1238450 RepID=A0AAV2VJG0_9VIBR|nr:CidB/LrgB family autolysis modulator [Vibrio nigripulchritudo]CCO44515.1 putative LrgA-associated membrane protein LrgB [Vibrio nigripulchritudo SOn1]
MWVLLTVVVFFFARSVARKFNSPIANPLVISVSIIIPVLVYSGVDFDTYYEQNKWFSYLLQPAVVALAYPLYEQLPEIRARWKIILLACGVGSVMSMFSSSMIAHYLGTDHALIASILGKSVTTPIAMEVSSYLGGEPAVSAILVLLVGVFGAVFAYPIYNLIGITHPIARGLTMGTVSHALGTAACADKNPKDAAFSSLALVVCGVLTSVLAPAFFALVVWLG